MTLSMSLRGLHRCGAEIMTAACLLALPAAHAATSQGHLHRRAIRTLPGRDRSLHRRRRPLVELWIRNGGSNQQWKLG